MTLRHGQWLAAIMAVIACSCRHALPPAIDPELTNCLTPATVWIAGIDLDRLRASALYPKIESAAALLTQTWREASYLVIASDGRNLLLISRGKFHEAPAGATLAGPGLAIGGPPESVRAAITQHQTGVTGAGDLVGHGGTVAPGATIWGAVRGGITLPLTGNLANLNRLLHLVDSATLQVKLNEGAEIDLAGGCRTAETGQQFEETLRAIFTLAGAASPRLDKALRPVEVVRDGTMVHARLSADAGSLSSLLGELLR